MHIALVGDRHDPVEALFVADRAERRGREDLRLAAGEDAAAVDARNVVDLAPDSPDLVGFAAVGTYLFIDDHLAQLFLFHRLDDLLEVRPLAGRRASAESSGFLSPSRSSASARVIFANASLRSVLSTMRIALATSSLKVFSTHFSSVASGFRSGNSRLALPALLGELVDRGDDFLDVLVRELDGSEELILGDLFAAALDHHDGLGGPGDDDVHTTGFVLR